MANPTMKLIASVTVGAGGAASIDFTSIPATYTDLVIKYSGRTNAGTTGNDLLISLNGSTANFTHRRLQGSGSGTPASYNGATGNVAVDEGQTATGSTFSNIEIYIPNYAGSTNKSISGDAVTENNGTEAYAFIGAVLWSQTAAINRITLTPYSGSIVQFSTAYLYGISNSQEIRQ